MAFGFGKKWWKRASGLSKAQEKISRAVDISLSGRKNVKLTDSKVSLSNSNAGKSLLGCLGCLGLIILGFIICGGFLSSPSNKKTTKEIGKTFEKIPEENQVVQKKPEPEKAKITELEPAIIDFEDRKQAFLEETTERKGTFLILSQKQSGMSPFH